MIVDKTSQIAHLRDLMRQADAEWEELARSIQVDRELLAVLHRYLDRCHTVMVLHGQRTGSPTAGQAEQTEVLERQVAWLEHQVFVENARRDVLAERFEEDRLALSVLRKSTDCQRGGRASRLAMLLLRAFKCLVHGLWLVLLDTGQWSMVIPEGQFFEVAKTDALYQP